MLYEWYCEKCKKEIQPVSVPMQLAGSVRTYLCPECGTEWNKFCMGLEAFQELRRLETIRESIVHARELHSDSPDIRLKRVLDAARECERQLCQAGLEWLGREV